MLELSHKETVIRIDETKNTAAIIGPNDEKATTIIRKAIQAGFPVRNLRSITLRTEEAAPLVLLIVGESLRRLLDVELEAVPEPAKRPSLVKEKIIKRMNSGSRTHTTAVLILSEKTRRFLVTVHPGMTEAGRIGFFGGPVERARQPIESACSLLNDHVAGLGVEPKLLTPLQGYQTDMLDFDPFLLVVKEEFRPKLNHVPGSAWMTREEILKSEIPPTLKYVLENDKSLIVRTDQNKRKIDYDKIVEDIIS